MVEQTGTDMEIRQELSTKLLQKLVLTPQLQLAIKLLQLSRLELAEEIRTQLDSNPVLEQESNGEDTLSFDDAAREAGEAEDVAPERAPVEQSAEEVAPIDRRDPVSPSSASEWERFVDNYRDYSNGPQIRVTNDEYPSVESTVSNKGNLADHLYWQLQLSDIGPRGRELGTIIIGNLNEDGYLYEMTVEDIAEQTGYDLVEVERALGVVQNFDPVGVAARSLQECLLIQAKALHPGNNALVRLITDHLRDLEKRNFAGIARGLRCSLDEVKALVATILAMEPKPGRGFATDDAIYIQPDVYVMKVGDEYVTVLNEDGLPKLKISQYYEQTLTGSAGEARDFIQDKMRSAMWLIRSIHQRQSTIRRVTESIMRFQRDFLEHGVSGLKPLVLRDVAEDVGMHESTISRVTTNKYVHTPRGIYELKYFFNSRISSAYGEDRSSESVKARIKGLVDNEDSKHPLSDQEIVSILRKENIVIARRTVAKYRDVLSISPSSRRRMLE